MTPDGWVYYWYATHDTSAHGAGDDVLLAVLLPLMLVGLVAMSVVVAVRLTARHDRPRRERNRLSRRERHTLIELERLLRSDDPVLDTALATMWLPRAAFRHPRHDRSRARHGR